MRPVPTIVFVHGVAMWPGLFGPVAAALDSPSTCWVRPGHADRSAVTGFDEQVAALDEFCEATGPALVVGVSGGATLALALALDHPEAAVGVVTHEPLVGPLVPALHDRVRAAGERLRAEPGPAAAAAFAASLYGLGPDREPPAPPEVDDWIARHWATTCAEVAEFAAFAPSPDALAAIRVPHRTTVGARSGPERHDVAGLLGAAGATVSVIEGCSHLAPLDAPQALAAVVTEALLHLETA